MMRRMDSGVSWFENEITNVIREGRNNPSVPIVIIGIEPEDLIPETKASVRAATARKRLDKALERSLKVKDALNIAKEKGNQKKIAAIETKEAECQKEINRLYAVWDIANKDAQKTEELKARNKKKK